MAMSFLGTDVSTSPRPRIGADGGDAVIGLSAALSLLAAAVAVLVGAMLVAIMAVAAAAVAVLAYRRSRQLTMTDDELERLRRAEQTLSVVSGPAEAAEQLAHCAADLLKARRVVVLIEGIGDTVRATAGGRTDDASGDVAGKGSRMRLLHHSGISYGSIAASARADGRPYGSRHDHILDALAERVSITLHQLDLIRDVAAERQTLADLINSSSDGIFSVGPDLRITSWNPAMASITGVSTEVAAGALVSDAFSPACEDGSRWTGPRTRHFGPEATEAEPLAVDVGDELRWVSCTYARLSNGGYVVIARDVTERKKLQDDKDGWIAQVSHELRTPLTPIRGFLQTLKRRNDTLSEEERTQILEVMLREEQRLEDLVNSLLQSSQLSEAGLAVAVQPVDWAVIVKEQVDVYRAQAPGREIAVDISGDLRPVLIDTTVATSVLVNLLSNALKYTEGPVAVELEADAGEIVTAVVDHGDGIARSDRERIFERFTRLGDHLTRRQQGVGLGLHIARRSVERLDGRIWVDETPGGGATFRFTLPMTGGPREGGS